MNEDEHTLAEVVRAIDRLSEVYRIGFERTLQSALYDKLNVKDQRVRHNLIVAHHAEFARVELSEGVR